MVEESVMTASKHLDSEEILRLAELVRAVQAQPQPQPKEQNSKNDFLDVIMKVAVSVCSVGIVWLISTVAELNTKMIADDVDQKYMKEQITSLTEKFNAFASVPRFTEKDYTQSIEPILVRLNRQDDQLTKRGLWMDAMDQRVQSLEHKFDTILDHQKDAKAQLELLVKERKH